MCLDLSTCVNSAQYSMHYTAVYSTAWGGGAIPPLQKKKLFNGSIFKKNPTASMVHPGEQHASCTAIKHILQESQFLISLRLHHNITQNSDLQHITCTVHQHYK